MTFAVEIEKEEDGRWIAEVPQIPGVMAYARTLFRTMDASERGLQKATKETKVGIGFGTHLLFSFPSVLVFSIPTADICRFKFQRRQSN